MVKNLTLSIDDDLLDRARVLAAMKRTSVNAMVRDFLDREVRREAQLSARAEKWTRLFEAADTDVERRSRHSCEGEPLFDRGSFYEEVMRERGLL
ncbi:DUF6364 family protein [Mangrovicella endophytica]|uniref:DUF6364 family protein n=1 Tax=Mangrovicella endophytica TaxID=2066697 RepID=UPI0012FFDE67|nr:DUF6364 family protein [Mangrovicella endophytica]